MVSTNFTKWVIPILLQSLGIFDNRLYSIISFATLTISMGIGIFGSVIGFLNNTEPIDRLESFTPISPQLSTLLMFLSVHISRPNILELLAKIQGNQKNTPNRTNSPIKRKITRLVMIMVVQSFCFTIPGWIYSLQQDSIQDKYSFIVPYWFSCGNQTSNSILQLVCWRIKNKKLLFIVNTVQVGGVIVCEIVYFAASTLYMIIVEELEKHLECIKSELSGLSRRVYEADFASLRTKCGRLVNISNENEIHRDLILIYNHQQFLNRFMLKTIYTWKGFITFFYINFGINTTLFIFLIFNELDHDKLLVTKVTLLGSTIFALAFIVANYAQHLSQMKEEIFDELGNVPWYKMNIKSRKIYLMMLTLNFTRVKVKIADMYEVNLNSFGCMVKASYSICNMLILKFVK